MGNTASETVERFLISKVFVRTDAGSTPNDPLRVLQGLSDGIWVQHFIPVGSTPNDPLRVLQKLREEGLRLKDGAVHRATTR